MTWFISDLHIGHKRIREFEPSRPENFEEVIRKNWIDRVAPADYIYVLGDIALCDKVRTADYYRSLPGRKVLLKGNHDSRSLQFYQEECGFVQVEPLVLPMFTQSGVVTMSHYPLTGVDPRYVNRMALIRAFHERIGAVAHIHGHTHSKRSPEARHINVCVEVRDYAPVCWADLRKEVEW
jgi:calcineurin-like phosphoesterase family protein